MNARQKTTVDYLAVRTQAKPMEAVEGFRPLFGKYGDLLRAECPGRGKHGYQAVFTLRTNREGRVEAVIAKLAPAAVVEPAKRAA